MVLTKTVDNRWMRRYRLFFALGVIILAVQIFLAVKFIASHTENSSNTNLWTPHNAPVYKDEGENSNSFNSARRNKDGLITDDEDASNVYYLKTSTNRIVAKGNQTVLRLEELDFTPPCEIATKEAVSAIHRARTQKCKQLIANTTCLIKQGLLYAASLPNFCANNDLEAGKSLGCFKDEKTYRILSGYYVNSKSSNSPENCVRLCIQSGFPYAGVQYSTECFCGNDEPPNTAKLPDSSCNMKCPRDPHLTCGGYFTMNVYQTGVRKFVPQTAEVFVMNKPRPVKIVFLLTLNGRALRQVRRLLKIIYNRDHYYYIHVDVRQDYLFRELLPLEQQFPNIRLTRRRFATIWGGASLLTMLLSCMQELLSLPSWRWDFVLNLSESDYPVKTIDKLTDFLTANKNRNFVKSHGREVQRFIQKQGLDKSFVECDTHMWRIGDRQLPWGVQIDGGSDWVALSRDFVKYVARNETDPLVSGLLVVFEHTLLPAESFFHTVLRNSRFCNTYIDNNLHVTNWKRKLGCKCQYKHVVDWCGCSPNDFKPEDWIRIQNTEGKQLFFARKFEPIVNQRVVLHLEQWLYGEEITKNVTNVNAYWQSVYSHLDLGPTDDALLTFAGSVARIKGRKLCKLPPKRILDVTTHHFDDAYQQTLVFADFGGVKLEIGVKPLDLFRATKSSLLAKRLDRLAVSTDYDQKEQILRNFARVLGPYSEPTLVYQFNASPYSSATSYNVTFLWIDPSGNLAQTSDAAIDETFTIHHVKPTLRQPLLPGVWTVKLLCKSEIHADLKFLVTPLQFFGGNTIKQNQVGFIHGGIALNSEPDESYTKFLPEIAERERLERLAEANAKRYDVDLEEWIDSLTLAFYRFENVCFEGKACSKSMQTCPETIWSSFAPDPKSHIGQLNETTGRFDPW